MAFARPRVPGQILAAGSRRRRASVVPSVAPRRRLPAARVGVARRARAAARARSAGAPGWERRSAGVARTHSYLTSIFSGSLGIFRPTIPP